MKFTRISEASYLYALKSEIPQALGWPGFLTPDGIAFLHYYNGWEWLYAKSKESIYEDEFFRLEPEDVFGLDA